MFATGAVFDAQGELEYATLAYDASTGAQLWASLHAGQATQGTAAADARSIVISPNGKVVYVTGFSGHAGAGGRIALGVYDYVTIAYDAATGKALWSARYDNGGNDQGRAIAISPSGNVVYVTGRSFVEEDRLRRRHHRLQRGHRQEAMGRPLQRQGQQERVRQRDHGLPGRQGGLHHRRQPRQDIPPGLRHRRLQRRDGQATVGRPLQRARQPE